MHGKIPCDICQPEERRGPGFWSGPKISERYLGDGGAQVLFFVRERKLTYNELDKTVNNLWSVLFTTGYLTQKGRKSGREYQLAIPNREIRELFVLQIREWFQEKALSDSSKLNDFCDAFTEEDPEKIEKLLSSYLWNTISIRDTASAKKENFYHGILLGLLGYKENWILKSNQESGIGYSDILVEIPENRTGIVIEVKYAENGNLDAACAAALQQIEEKCYAAKLKEDGMHKILKYGLACHKKECREVLETLW